MKIHMALLGSLFLLSATAQAPPEVEVASASVPFTHGACPFYKDLYDGAEVPMATGQGCMYVRLDQMQLPLMLYFGTGNDLAKDTLLEVCPLATGELPTLPHKTLADRAKCKKFTYEDFIRGRFQ